MHWARHPDLWTRFQADLAYQECVLRWLVVRHKTVAAMARGLLPFVANPVWSDA
jgi:hypothetical protein